MLSRIIYGTRVSLLVAGVTIATATTFGILMGIVAGYLEGAVGTVIMTIVDGQLSFPFLLLAIAVAGAMGASFLNVIVVLVLTTWVTFARLTYGLVLSVKQKDYVEAARAIGVSGMRIMRVHIFPQIITPNVATATVFTGQIILAEAALSFLGVGIPPTIPTWGTILSEGRDYLVVAPWITFYPGVALVLTVLGVTLLGDWMRTVVDPRQRE
jgi:peptide/nickel transport system permease protein